MIILSYPLDENIPLYGSTLPIQFIEDRSFDKNDTCNTRLISFSNHSGTHIDVPSHFIKDGKTVIDVLKQINTFEPMVCLNIKKDANQIIYAEDIKPFNKDIKNVEALFIRTGFYQFRKRNPSKYKSEYPVIDQNVPKWLKKNCKKLKIFGLDCISVGYPTKKELGSKVHRNFLKGENSINIIEDINLSNRKIINGKWILTLIPVFVAPIDATPIVLIAHRLR